MKFLYIASASTFAFGAMLAPAAAADIEERCTNFVEENELDYTGCACLGEKADADEDLKEAILALETREDFENMPDEVREVFIECGEE